jgi:hypothetical protein
MDRVQISTAMTGAFPGLIVWSIVLLILFPLTRLIMEWATSSRIPIVNKKSLSDLFGSDSRSDFAAHGRQIFDQAVQKFPQRPFRVHSELGLMTVLPPSMADEVRNDPRLSFAKHTEKVSLHRDTMLHIQPYMRQLGD